MVGAERWVLLLRGVNVGGVKVTSAALREVCAGLGLQRVRTVRASGNAVLDVPAGLLDDGSGGGGEDGPVGQGGSRSGSGADGGARDAALRAVVEAALRERFGYDAFVVVLPVAALRAVCAGYPFERDDDLHHPYVVFTSDRGALGELAASAGVGAEEAGAAEQAGPSEAAPGDGDAEQLRLAGDVLYWRCPRGSSTDTAFARLSAAARWKPHVATRNLRTLAEVLAAADG